MNWGDIHQQAFMYPIMQKTAMLCTSQNCAGLKFTVFRLVNQLFHRSTSESEKKKLNIYYMEEDLNCSCHEDQEF